MKKDKLDELIIRVRLDAAKKIDFVDDQSQKILGILMQSLDKTTSNKGRLLMSKEIVKTLREAENNNSNGAGHNSRSMYSVRPKDNEIMIRTIRNIKEGITFKDNNAKQIRQSLVKYLKKLVDSSCIETHSNFYPCGEDQLELKLSVFLSSKGKLEKVRTSLVQFIEDNKITDANTDKGILIKIYETDQEIEILPVEKVYRSGKGFERETNHLGIRIIGKRK